MQDISSEDGEHLHTLCQTIIEEGPLVFIPLAEENKNKKYQEEVPLYVKKWSAFKELVIVLRANLQEIVDRLEPLKLWQYKENSFWKHKLRLWSFFKIGIDKDNVKIFKEFI